MIEFILGVLFGKFAFGGHTHSIWEWAKFDGYNIKKSDWLPEGHSPSDMITRKEWDKLKSINQTKV